MPRCPIYLLLAVAVAACGGVDSNTLAAQAGDRLCTAGTVRLESQLGPEMGEITQKMAITKTAGGPMGCGIAYTLVPEEMYGEDLPTDEVHDAKRDHHLAVHMMAIGSTGTLHLIDPSEASPGAVILTLENKDITGDGKDELLVQEDAASGATGYRGLRMFAIGPEAEPPVEIFSEALRVTTPEGLDLLAQWKTGNVGSSRAIILEGGGARKIFTWDATAQRYALDEAASAKHSAQPNKSGGIVPSGGGDDVPSPNP